MKYDELVKKLKKPCGRTTGHGDSCSEGWMCKACEEKNQAADAITTLQAELEQCRKDAERYRWLCDNSYDRDGFLQFQVWKHSWEPHSQTGIPIEWKCRVRGPAIDAAIDKAMESV